MPSRLPPSLKKQSFPSGVLKWPSLLWDKVKNDIAAKPAAGLLLAGYFVLLWYVFGLVPALLLLIGLAFLVYRWDARILIVATGVLLLGMILFVVIGLNEVAQEAAMYAFFFAIIWFFSQLFSLHDDR